MDDLEVASRTAGDFRRFTVKNTAGLEDIRFLDAFYRAERPSERENFNYSDDDTSASINLAGRQHRASSCTIRFDRRGPRGLQAAELVTYELIAEIPAAAAGGNLSSFFGSLLEELEQDILKHLRLIIRGEGQ